MMPGDSSPDRPPGPKLAAALGYLKRGWSVIPLHTAREDDFCACGDPYCKSIGKHPSAGKWKRWSQQPPSERQVREWWDRTPDANVGIPTGIVSGLVVIDVDDRHGGEEEWRDLAAECGLPETASVRTPNGRHYYFARPPDVEQIGNRTGIRHGIDVRADGGYVVAPPSTRERGGEYVWEVGTESEDEIPPLAMLPAALLKIIRAQAADLGDGAKKNPKIEFAAYARIGESDGAAGRAAAEGRMPPDIEEGSRNDTLTRIAGHLAAKAAPLNWESISAQLKRIDAACCKPPLDDPQILESMARRFTALERRKRQADELIGEHLRGGGIRELVEPEDRRVAAEAIFARLQVEIVRDWSVVWSHEGREYYLRTPDSELSLGDDILDYKYIREQIANELGVLPPVPSKLKEWEQLAVMLRRYAREEYADITDPEDEIADWLDQFISIHPVREDLEADEREEWLRSSAITAADQDGLVYLHLQPDVLAHFVKQATGDNISPSDVRKKLTRAHWRRVNLRCGERVKKVWRAPEEYRRN